MSELRWPPENGASPSADEEQVRRLLELAGRRPEPPAEDLAQIRAAARAVWEERFGQRRLRRVRFTDPPVLAVAAVLLAAVGVAAWWWGWRSGGILPRPVATVETVAGAVTVVGAPDDPSESSRRPVSAGESIVPGTGINTGGNDQSAGRTALRLASGASLRIDGGSQVRLLAAGVVELQRGALYVDSGAERGSRAVVEVRTAVGVARDLGTQFEVRLLAAGEAAMRVRVREGAVVVEQGATSYRAADGVELTLHADGSVARTHVSAHGPEWEWILSTAPRLDIEGRTLSEFLAWVARETGWKVHFADPAVAASAAEIILHGAIGEVTPDEAPGVVLPGAGLSSRLVDGTLIVGTPDSMPAD